jgi:hypothetical protein
MKKFVVNLDELQATQSQQRQLHAEEVQYHQYHETDGLAPEIEGGDDGENENEKPQSVYLDCVKRTFNSSRCTILFVLLVTLTLTLEQIAKTVHSLQHEQQQIAKTVHSLQFEFKLDKLLPQTKCRNYASLSSKVHPHQVAKKGLLRLGQVAGSHKRKEVVMGLAFGYDGAAVRDFVESLRATGYCGDIVFGVKFGQCASGEFSRLVAEQQVQLRFVQKEKNIPLASSRMKWYSEWLDDYNNEDLVMMTDVRDVFFQRRPFDGDVAIILGAGKKDLILSYESNDDIKHEFFNAQWIRGCWGDAALQEIGDKPVSCSGATYGTKAGIKRYLSETAVEYT